MCNEWQLNVAVSHNKIVDILSVQGNFAEALTAYQQVIAISELLAKSFPDNPAYKNGLVEIYAKLAGTYGNIAWQELFIHHPDAAIAAAEKGLASIPLRSSSKATSPTATCSLVSSLKPKSSIWRIKTRL